MSASVRKLLIVLGVLVGLAAIACASGWAWLRASLPAVTGRLALPGLDAPVDIVRDRWGVPTIATDSETRAFYALGFAHAQDRFFQMELHRRLAAGRLAELVGPGAVAMDEHMRRFGLAPAAERSIDALSPRTRAVLTAYAEGVNAWLAASKQRLPPEWDALHMRGGPSRPEPWRPADSIASVKLLSLILDGDYAGELAAAELEAKVGPERAAQLLHPKLGAWADGTAILPASTTPSSPTVPTPPVAPARPDTPGLDGGVLARASALRAALGALPGIGSNSWVIAGSRTKRGAPILSNDPHLETASPSPWYEARITTPTLSASGVTMPGVPAIILGRNARVAWGITALGGDVQDLFIERVAPGDAGAYVVGDGVERFVTRKEQIRVAGGAPVELELRSTRHGPIIEDDWKGRGPLALSWTALAADDTTLDALLAVDRAHDFADFEAAFAQAVAPTVNLTYADVDGHIGYLAAGRIPRRSSGDGAHPLDGTPADAKWSGFVPTSEMPRVLDPPEGFIVSANQQVRQGAPLLATQFAPPFRARRIRELLSGADKLDLADMSRLHADVTSVAARELVAYAKGLTAEGPVARSLAMMQSFDGRVAADSGAAMLYEAWTRHLVPRIFEDEVGRELSGLLSDEHALMALHDPDQRWCDDQKTPARESCRDIALLALEDARAELVRHQGADPSRWRFGRVARVTFASRIFDPIPVLGRLFMRVVPYEGDATTVRVAAYGPAFSASLVSSFYGDYDLAPRGVARVVTAPGQCAHPLSAHFDDLVEPWRRIDAPPFDPPSPDGATTLHLVPR